MRTAVPFERPLYVMLKPVGAACNMRCGYCYYLGKGALYPTPGPRRMSEETLERFTEQYIEAQTGRDVMFCWHGGEAMLLPISFYERAMRLQQRHAGGRRIANCIQTNGTLITDEWASFLRCNGWLAGVSIDGPEAFHDEFRRTRGGGPTWARVRRGIDVLERHGVEWNAMAVVNSGNAGHPVEFYRFFRDELGCRYLQFSPIMERGLGCNVGPREWGEFLCGVFDEWVRRDVGEMFVQIFDATLANWAGQAPGVCSMARHCGHAAVMEHNGDVYSCDHYVFPEYRLGNIYGQTLVEMMYGERQLRFGRMKRDALPGRCRGCEWLFACNGECPKNRGADGVSLLCEGYRLYFAHVAGAMGRMTELLGRGLPPADVMKR